MKNELPMPAGVASALLPLVRQIQGIGFLFACVCLYMCPHSTVYVSSYCYICVLILLYMCPHTSIYGCPHTTIYVCPHTVYMCPQTTIYVSYDGREIENTVHLSIYVSSYYYIVLMPIFLCPHITLDAS